MARQLRVTGIALAALLSLNAPTARAEAGHVDDSRKHPVEKRLESPLWLQELQKQVRVFPRDTDLFHWGKLSDFKGIGEELTRGLAQFNEKDGRWQSGTLGGGLYFSSDPISTFAFGGSGGNWVLLRARVKAGTRFLDLEGEHPFSKKAQAEIVKAGCPIGPFNSHPDFGILVSDYPPCRALLLTAVKELGISFLSDYYEGVSHIDSVLSGYRARQFILSSKLGIDEDRMRALTPAIPSPDPDARARSLIKGAFEHYSDKSFTMRNLWPAVKGANQSAVDAYLRDRVLGPTPANP